MADALIKDKVKAEMWISDVNNEIELVNQVLSDCDAACMEMPDEDDPVYCVARGFAQKATELWNNMIKNFRAAADNLATVIKKYDATTNEVVDKFQEVVNKVGK